MNNSVNNQNGVYYMPTKSKKSYKPFEKKDTVFVLFTVIASFLMVDFAAFHGFRAGFTIAYFVLFAVTSAYLWKKESKSNVFSLICGALSLAGAVTFLLFDNELVNTIMLFLVFGLYGFYTLGISNTYRRARGSFRSLLDLFESVLIEPFSGVEEVFGSAKETSKKNRSFINSIIGVAIAVPFLAIIIPLLMKSDAAFESLIERVIKNIGVYLLELGIALAATPFLFSFLFSKKEASITKTTLSDKKLRFLAPTVSISFLCVIALTYAVYLLSQLAYFFSAFKGILPADYHYTASAFARRGFYEMFAVCVINVLIISAVGAVTKRESGRVSPVIKALSLFITMFSLLLIIIAMQKMKLNISIYGLSSNRVLVTAFMIMVLVTLAFFIVHIFVPKISYLQPIIIICSAFFIALSFANIDARCAEYNVEAYKSGKIEMLDTVTIRRSSDSAIPYLLELAKGDDETLANSARNQLVMYVKNTAELDFDKEGRVKADSKIYDFRRYNYSRITAMNGVCDYFDSLDENEKASVQKMLAMYNNYTYVDEEDCFYDYSNDKFEIRYYYNPKTGNYDKIKKNTW
ncbi:MAG: DUF4173 domain-containing protein [Eubacterium sp.]|nr:DUF4173 domain-containing protein [Eubacterium sp.]